VTCGLNAVCEINSDVSLQHADLMTTFVAEAGGTTESMQGIDLRSERREAAIAQLSANEALLDRFCELNPDFDTDRFHKSLATAVRTYDFKYEQSEEKTVLYDLPNEEADVSDAHPDTRERLEAIRDDWVERIGEPVVASEGAAFTDRMEEQLKHLGYV
jgi:hypothetical protein